MRVVRSLPTSEEGIVHVVGLGVVVGLTVRVVGRGLVVVADWVNVWCQGVVELLLGLEGPEELGGRTVGAEVGLVDAVVGRSVDWLLVAVGGGVPVEQAATTATTRAATPAPAACRTDSRMTPPDPMTHPHGPMGARCGQTDTNADPRRSASRRGRHTVRAGVAAGRFGS
jgi:hypothetical protein